MSYRLQCDVEWRLCEELERYKSHAARAHANASGPGLLSTAIWAANMEAWARWTLRAEEVEAKLGVLLAKRDLDSAGSGVASER